MKKLITLLIVMAAFWPLQSQAEQISNLSLCDSPWAPFTYGEEGQLAEHGYGIEIAKELYSRLGIETEISLIPWKRCLFQIKLGQYAGTSLLLKTEDRSRYMVFSNPVLMGYDLVWYNTQRLKSLTWNTFEDLKQYTIGLTAGFYYGKEFEQAAAKYDLHTEEAPTDEMNLAKLATGRIDLFLNSHINMGSLLRKHPEMQKIIASAPKKYHKQHYRIGLSKRSPAQRLIPQMNRIIKEMKQDGTIEDILSKSYSP